MMKTEKLFLNNTVQRNEDLQLWVSEYAEETGISEKNALRVSLLVEETVGKLHALSGCALRRGPRGKKRPAVLRRRSRRRAGRLYGQGWRAASLRLPV